jgi:hypothetical protein
MYFLAYRVKGQQLRVFLLSTLSKQAEHILHVHPVIFRNLLTFLTFYMPEPSPAALLILSTRGIWYWFLQQGGWGSLRHPIPFTQSHCNVSYGLGDHSL